jgi:hypothetical protein
MAKADRPIFWIIWAVATAALVFSPTLPIAVIGLAHGSLFGTVAGLAVLACAGLLFHSARRGAKGLYRPAYIALAAAALCVAGAYAAASQMK